MEIRNKSIFIQVRNLADSFIDVLDNKFTPSYGTMFERVKTLVTGDPNLIAEILELRPDIEEKLLSKCLTRVQQCLKTLLEEDVCRKPPHASTKEGYQDELTWFLTKVLEDRENQKSFFTKEALKKQYEETLFCHNYSIYENYLYNPYPRDYLVCPINNLTSSIPIDLESWKIRRISNDEFSILVESHEKQGIRLEVFPEFIIYLYYDTNWQDTLRKIVSTLRLLKREKIFLKRIYHAFQFPFHTWQIMNAPERTKIADEISHSSFNIEMNDKEELKRLWTVLNGMRETDYILTALRRFNLAYERERQEDAWVDYFISLESLFFSGEMAELTYRLSNRISKALGGDTFCARKKMKEKITYWYNVRSRIVHGTGVKSKELNQIDELNETVRASLKWFINNDNWKDHDRILNLLDLMH